MTGQIYSNRFICWGALVLVILAGNVVQAAQIEAVTPRVIEVFTLSDLPITGRGIAEPAPGRPTADLQIYNLDGIRHTEAKLSKGLPADPEQSKRVVLQRFQQLSEEDRTRMQRAAMGLAKAMQYGVGRYPAIVFDGQAVVYGVTDVQTALAHYRAWRREGKR